ncbi:receptor-interacting serine/threonine-protein kinase 2 isoform X2 [Triplophysa rosa]|uniref:Receptor-interacting serine/threonine-protein kinase 2-like n=1 Tax=Triplophysa rosa TaxID=992332 RepID=A0A9W7X3I1_TRIRA|nr:receptor-interacting serine/threonine-protein kinase 2 isoform X2 [Triplophysa rosa]KAI7813885.1 putative receptor-interacting serine/threonine-protein kinase 2-like [Triplophysa rosa]
MAQVNHLQDFDEKDLRDVVLIRTSVGACLRGCFRSTGRQVAVKLLTDSKWIDRLQRVRICCEHVLVPLGVYRANSLVGLVWDWMTEGSLDSTLHETDLFPELSTALCLRILLDVAEGLSHLHAIPLPHGALKATNVLLDQQYRAKLCDWGQEIDMHLIMNTSSGCRPCYRDLAYMSPKGAIPSVEADIYSFGILLWETLNRKRPCEGMDQLQALLLSAQEKLELGVRGDRLEPMTPQNHVLTQLIIRCLHNNPKKRPSAQECAVVLRTALAVFEPQTFTDAVLHLKTWKEKTLDSSWELPIELHNLESGSCTDTKKWTSKVIPRNETCSSKNPKLEAKGKVSAQTTRRGYPQIRCCMDTQNNSVQSGSSCRDHGFTQTPGHCGSPQRQSPTSLRSHCVSPAALNQSTLQNNAGNQVTCQMSLGRSCCQLLQERREAIVRFMTEGRLNNLLDVLRARQAVTRETYEIITAALTLNARTRCLLDICSCLGENVAILVATTLGLVSTKNTQEAYKWQAG